ncbi:uncharacterized protein LOC110018691 [Phalaenopsis equestris]|uniref:uncharacterized protein LOC110018691 n=1 Tax=Phalaenopsis equestris TaxID=78828 RepID=UPI0009E360E7|nr:uncharacterized protein LOC110018691 [Phalaenopsis equestris]
MGESLLASLSMENHDPSTLLSMDPTGGCPFLTAPPSSSHEDFDREIIQRQIVLYGPPDINLPVSSDQSSSQFDHCELLDVGLGTQFYEADSTVIIPKPGSRKCGKRGDAIWGAWFFFNFYFKPILAEKSKGKILRDGSSFSGFEKSDIRLDVFLVQHDMENMYMWVFKERAEMALGKMQLRSFMNGHSRHGEPEFPFNVEKGFVRSHRMQRKQYRGLSNPQCVHGIEVVTQPNLSVLPEPDCKKWAELTGRELNFSIPPDASDYSSWRNLPSTEFELERPPPLLKPMTLNPHQKKLLNSSGLNLSAQPSNHSTPVGIDLSSSGSKRKKDYFSHGMEEDYCSPSNSNSDRAIDIEMNVVDPPWLNEFTGVMRQAYGPVTAGKTIYEDHEGYLIMVSLPFSDQQRVKVSWRNTLTHGIVKILCFSTARMPYIKRHERTFKLTDPCPEHCPSGEFIREIPLATRIPEDAQLEAYYDETGAVLEIMVPKHRAGSEEHEVRVSMRPPHLVDPLNFC